MCLSVSMVYTRYLPNTLNLIVYLESFRDHKTSLNPIIQGPYIQGTNKAFIVKQNNLVNYFKIFLLFFSKFTSSNIYGLNQTSINIQYKVKAFFYWFISGSQKNPIGENY